MNDIERYRYFMKDSIRKEIDFRQTDQNRGVPPPPWQKPADPWAERTPLPSREAWEGKIGRIDLISAVGNRVSRRAYGTAPLTPEELAFLLWITQGLRGRRTDRAILRTVPSAGARHSFETYLFVRNVEGVEKGIHRYLADEEALVLERRVDDMDARLVAACMNQSFVSKGAVTFVWASLPYRMEWRYSLSGHRAVLLDAGHVAQNLYLGCEAIGAGTCAVGAYDQEALDALMGLDGQDEFVVYLAPVGKRM